MQLLFSVPSLGLDESKGPPSFLFVTHQLVLDEFPYQFPESAGFFVSNCWLGPVGEYTQRIVLSHPQGEVLLDTTDRPFQLEDSTIPYTAITFFQGLEIVDPGLYTVSVFCGDELKSEYPLHIHGDVDASSEDR